MSCARGGGNVSRGRRMRARGTHLQVEEGDDGEEHAQDEKEGEAERRRFGDRTRARVGRLLLFLLDRILAGSTLLGIIILVKSAHELILLGVSAESPSLLALAGFGLGGSDGYKEDDEAVEAHGDT